MCVQWKVNRSPVYTFLTKISHDVTMNPYWTHLCQKALLQPSLPLYASFSVPPLPPPCSVLTSWIFQAHPPPPFFDIAIFSKLLFCFQCFSVPRAFLSSWLFFWAFQSFTDLPECPHSPKMPGCCDSHKLCPGLRFCFVFYREFTECMGASQRIKAYGKKQEWGEHKRKKVEGMREYWGKVWWGQREGSQRTTYGSDSVITANLWAQKERSSFPCLFPCT